MLMQLCRPIHEDSAILSTIFDIFLSLELKQYYERHMNFVSKQLYNKKDIAMSVINTNASLTAAAAEWENEWNQAGLGSRLSEQVGEFMLHWLARAYKMLVFISSKGTVSCTTPTPPRGSPSSLLCLMLPVSEFHVR